jgi:predicted Zn finger-like uncharacterized protein
MADNQYPCPECGTVLRAAKPLAAGKRVKCPKCEHIFAPVADGGAPRPAAAAKATVKPKADDTVAGGDTYGFSEDEEQKAEEKTREERKKAMGPLQDRRPKSARGPAQAIATKPSNQMLGTSTIICVSCIISIVVILWPLVFRFEKKADEFNPKAPKPKVLSEEEKKQLAIRGAVIIGFAVLAFVYNGFIAVGAVKMQSLASYSWAMAASFLIMLPFNWALAYPAFDWFIKLVVGIAGEENYYLFAGMTVFVVAGWSTYVGAWNLVTLRKPEVRAGFEEKKPGDV